MCGVKEVLPKFNQLSTLIFTEAASHLSLSVEIRKIISKFLSDSDNSEALKSASEVIS